MRKIEDDGPQPAADDDASKKVEGKPAVVVKRETSSGGAIDYLAEKEFAVRRELDSAFRQVQPSAIGSRTRGAERCRGGVGP
jgi:hypothetical protein